MNQKRSRHSAVLHGSKLLVIGGVSGLNNMLQSIESLDITNSNLRWILMPSLKLAWSYGSVEVQNNLIYVIGTSRDPVSNRDSYRNLEIYNFTNESSTVIQNVFVEQNSNSGSYSTNQVIATFGGLYRSGLEIASLSSISTFKAVQNSTMTSTADDELTSCTFYIYI